MPTPATMVKLMKALGMKPNKLVQADDPAAIEAVTSKLSRKGAKPTEQDVYQEIARINAAMSPKVGGLGLPYKNKNTDRAKALKYIDDVSGNLYRGQHQAPISADDVGTAMYQLNKGVYPDDIYSSRASQYYGDGADPDRDAALMRRLQAHRGNPESASWMYRAVPKDAPQFIQHGDWVTPEKQYAIEHGEGALGGNYKIIASRAPAKALFTDGNSIYEFGYDASQRFAEGPASIPIVRSQNPSNLERSRFAAFDPARVNENNLLASRLLPFALPGLLAIPQDE